MTNRKILMVQFRTDVSLELERQSILKHSGLNKKDIEFYNVFDKNNSYGKLFGKIKKIKPAVILGGSGEFYVGQENIPKTRENRIRKMLKGMRPIIAYFLEKNIPVLGICFGHQIFAKCLGYEVKNDPDQVESNAFEIKLNQKGVKDPLFECIQKSFNAILGHKDSVMKIPKGAVLLGSSKRCKNQIIKYSDKIYTVQFHPEMDLKDLAQRIALYPSYLPAGEKEIDTSKVVDEVNKIIPNFLKIAEIKQKKTV